MDQNVPSSTPFGDTANANASARRTAVAGSSEPSTGDQQNVDGRKDDSGGAGVEVDLGCEGGGDLRRVVQRDGG